jgi:hypothetical protein
MFRQKESSELSIWREASRIIQPKSQIIKIPQNGAKKVNSKMDVFLRIFAYICPAFLIANLAHAGTIVDHKSGNFFVAHFAVAELLRNLKSEKSAGNFAERRALTVDKNELAWWMESAFSSAPPSSRPVEGTWAELTD